MEVDAPVDRAGSDALAALRAHRAVDAPAGGLARLRLRQGRLHLGEVEGRRVERGAVGRRGVEREGLLAGNDLGHVDDGEPVVEAVERATRQPAVDHVGGAPALADGPGDVRGAIDRIARGEDVRDLGLAGHRIRREEAARVARNPAGEGARVGAHPDRTDDELAGQDELAAGQGFRAPPARGIGLAEAHPRATEAAHRAPRVAEDLDRGDLEAEPDALPFGVGALDVVGRHLAATAAIGNGHGCGPEAARGPCGVHRHVASADDHHPLAGQVHRLAELDLAQEVRATEDAQAILARYAEVRRTVGARRHEDGVEALRLEARRSRAPACPVTISTPKARTLSMSRSTTASGSR